MSASVVPWVCVDTEVIGSHGILEAKDVFPGYVYGGACDDCLERCFLGLLGKHVQGTKNYPFELFYWDYILGVVVVSLGIALTLGSHGNQGESFLANIRTTNGADIFYSMLGGFIFNVANLLLVAGIAMAGLAIAFPIAIGIAVVEGVVLSYALQPKGNPAYLAGGVALATVAIIFDAFAYKRLGGNRVTRKGIVVNVISGLLV